MELNKVYGSGSGCGCSGGAIRKKQQKQQKKKTMKRKGGSSCSRNQLGGKKKRSRKVKGGNLHISHYYPYSPEGGRLEPPTPGGNDVPSIVGGSKKRRKSRKSRKMKGGLGALVGFPYDHGNLASFGTSGGVSQTMNILNAEESQTSDVTRQPVEQDLVVQ